MMLALAGSLIARGSRPIEEVSFIPSRSEQRRDIARLEARLLAGVTLDAHPGTIGGPWIMVVTSSACESCRMSEADFAATIKSDSILRVLLQVHMQETKSSDALISPALCRLAEEPSFLRLNELRETLGAERMNDQSQSRCSSLALRPLAMSRSLMDSLGLPGVPVMVGRGGVARLSGDKATINRISGATVSGYRSAVWQASLDVGQLRQIGIVGVQNVMLPAKGQPIVGEVKEARLLDGNAILLTRSREVLHVDGGSKVVRALGREGDGPGEYRYPTHIMIGNADSVWVYDQVSRRLSAFTTRGKLQEEWILPQLPGLAYPSVVGVLRNGSLVVRKEAFVLRAEGPPRRYRDTVEVSILSRQDSSVTALGRFPGTEFEVVPRVAGRSDGTFRQHPLEGGARLLSVVGPNWIAIMDTQQPIVSFYDSSGQLVQRLLVSREDSRLTGGAEAPQTQFAAGALADGLGRLWIPLAPEGPSVSERLWLRWDPVHLSAVRLSLGSPYKLLDADNEVLLAVQDLLSGEQQLVQLQYSMPES